MEKIKRVYPVDLYCECVLSRVEDVNMDNVRAMESMYMDEGNSPLSQNELALLLAHYKDKKSYRVLANEYGNTERTVQNWMKTIREKLRVAMKKRYGDGTEPEKSLARSGSTEEIATNELHKLFESVVPYAGEKPLDSAEAKENYLYLTDHRVSGYFWEVSAVKHLWHVGFVLNYIYSRSNGEDAEPTTVVTPIATWRSDRPQVIFTDTMPATCPLRAEYIFPVIAQFFPDRIPLYPKKIVGTSALAG